MKSYSFSKLVVRGYPTMADLRNPYIYTSDIRVVINVSGHPYPKDVEDFFRTKEIRTYFFPLVEEGEDMGLSNLLQALRVLDASDKNGEKVLLHCECGNNRSRTVAEAFYYMKCGEQFEDEYKGYKNHLIYNCETGHLPKEDMESILDGLRNELNVNL